MISSGDGKNGEMEILSLFLIFCWMSEICGSNMYKEDDSASLRSVNVNFTRFVSSHSDKAIPRYSHNYRTLSKTGDPVVSRIATAPD